MWRGWPMLVDCYGNRHDLARLRVAQFGACTAIDCSRWQVEQHIDDTRRIAVEQTRIKFVQLWSNPGQAGKGSKQRIEHGRPHAPHHCKVFASLPGLLDTRPFFPTS